MVGEVGGGLRHAPGVARGADAPALARKGDEEVVAAFVAPVAGEAIGEDDNGRRPHTALGDRTPDEAYFTQRTLKNAA